MKKKTVIPVFVPHMGCPFNCIFCDQKKISGQSANINREKMTAIVKSHLDTVSNDSSIEIAFYGGSFTGIPVILQNDLLEAGFDYVRAGVVERIRLSTRPDMIDRETVKRLQKYGVGLVELGVQSLDNEVLEKSGRGHTAEDVYEAVGLIRETFIKVGIQTMIGLPGDTSEKALNTARKVVDIIPETVRIYPTLVIRGTPLERMYKQGYYTPLSLDEASVLCARLLDIYSRRNVNVIRVGLQPTDIISASGQVVAGPFHPSFRHLAETFLMRERVLKEITDKRIKGPGVLKIHTSIHNISNVTGYKKENTHYLCDRLGFSTVKVVGSTDIKGYEIRVEKVQ